MRNVNLFENLLRGFVLALLVLVFLIITYLGINAAFYIKRTYLTYPDSSVAQLELKVLNHEQRLRMIERWIVRNSRLKDRRNK